MPKITVCLIPLVSLCQAIYLKVHRSLAEDACLLIQKIYGLTVHIILSNALHTYFKLQMLLTDAFQYYVAYYKY